MRLLPLMLLVVCCSASAEWVIVSTSDSAVFFVDKDKIRRQGNIRRYWVLSNFLTEQKNGAWSWRSLDEINCKEETQRLIEMSMHTETWAKGETISIAKNNDQGWDQIPPGTVIENISKFVCSK